jgi:flotillin
MSAVSPIAIAVVAVVVTFFLVALLYAKNYVKVPPNMVAVFTGRGRPKIVRGGARFRVPVLERVDFMSLEPFNIQVSVGNAISSNGVGIAVDVVALIRFGSTDEAIETGTQRFLTVDRTELRAQLTEIISGNMRAICAKMTVEDLNSNRDQLTRSVAEEAGAALAAIGMEIDVLTIQDVRDRNGYIEALGRKRIAEVTRDAEVGEAQARRDARIAAALASQEGQTAEIKAREAIAEAERALAIKQAAIDTEVEAAQARASQAGPLADSEARRAVVLAEVETERERTERQIAVEQQRAAQREKALEADVIAPAEAERAAVTARAEGAKRVAIANAEAIARQRELQGDADLKARTAGAAALQREGEAQAQVDKARLLAAADGQRAQMLAEAEGQKAALLAEAEGQKELAVALSAFNDEAARLRVLPDLIAALPLIAREVAAPVGNISNLTVMSGGGDGQDALSRVAGSVPALLLQVLEAAKVGGIDLGALLGGVTETPLSRQTESSRRSVEAAPEVPVEPHAESAAAGTR